MEVFQFQGWLIKKIDNRGFHSWASSFPVFYHCLSQTFYQFLLFSFLCLGLTKDSHHHTSFDLFLVYHKYYRSNPIDYEKKNDKLTKYRA